MAESFIFYSFGAFLALGGVWKRDHDSLNEQNVAYYSKLIPFNRIKFTLLIIVYFKKSL